MRISECNWSAVETYLGRDDRAVLPLGCTEQHAHLSLATDSILAERVAAEAAEPLGVPVFPVLAYGITPTFRSYPGTVSLRVATFLQVVGDVLDGLAAQGFRRILIVNGHGGNAPVHSLRHEWVAEHPGHQVVVHDWWNAPRVSARVKAIDPRASHASWMENFPWTRIEGVRQPNERKPLVDFDRLRRLDPAGTRALLGEGNFGGWFERPDEEVLSVWSVAVEETRGLLESVWETSS